MSEVKLAGRRMFAGFVRDIIERKNAEKSLLPYAALVESSDDAIIGKTLGGRITSRNRGAEMIFGSSSKKMIGKLICVLIPKNQQDEEPRILEKMGRNESVDHYETARQRKNGKLIDISVTVSPIHDAEGNTIEDSKVARDIARKIHLSVKTVEAHRANIKAKLKLKSAPELIRSAVRGSESQGAGP